MTTADPKGAFKARVCEWAEKLNVEVKSVTVRPLKTKWASCSNTGRLTFDSQVPELDEALRDYVVVHELLHLRIPNHGPVWKSLMRSHLGAYEQREERLRQIVGSGRTL